MSDTLVGMGAIVAPDGVGFRVWAPHAETVAVTGDFVAWDAAGSPLTREGGGYWYGFVPGAAVGQEYRYVLTNGGNRIERVDRTPPR